MKKLMSVLALGLILTSCQESQRIAFVDNVKVFDEYQKKIDLEANIKTQQEAFKVKTDSLNQAYQMEAAPLQAKFSNLSPQQQQSNSEILAFSQKWNRVNTEVKAQEQKMQEQFEKDLKELDEMVEESVADYAKKNNISFVVGKNASGNLVYGTETADITETIIKELNDAYSSKDDSQTNSEDSTEDTTK
jgi:outer membrane protein